MNLLVALSLLVAAFGLLVILGLLGMLDVIQDAPGRLTLFLLGSAFVLAGLIGAWMNLDRSR